jgi:Lon protease-like protein
MVLPGAVLFPNTILPLRIFEPRYRAMLQWALERDRMFSVALMKPDIIEAKTEDQFFHTAGVGLIAASVTQTDGTSNLMLHGLARVRFTGFSQRAPFRIAQIQPLSEIATEPTRLGDFAEKLRAQIAGVRMGGSALQATFTDAIMDIKDPGVLADTIANSLVADAGQRQRLLEERNTEARLRELMQILGNNFPDGPLA